MPSWAKWKPGLLGLSSYKSECNCLRILINKKTAEISAGANVFKEISA
jgi:hypothetical protein